ncbi:hypothetical protein [Halomicrobium urmianum]|uniref:hypothetical protein n=1 Tax=Halomicrobium urmianum TaxID=1586233 RepID=UPI001CD97BFA|nr:hypothetical protein [Halomicrobium urmianum]
MPGLFGVPTVSAFLLGERLAEAAIGTDLGRARPVVIGLPSVVRATGIVAPVEPIIEFVAVLGFGDLFEQRFGPLDFRAEANLLIDTRCFLTAGFARLHRLSPS